MSRKVNTDYGYIRKPKEREGYRIECNYCECGCKQSLYSYVKVKKADKKEIKSEAITFKLTSYMHNGFWKTRPILLQDWWDKGRKERCLSINDIISEKLKEIKVPEGKYTVTITIEKK